MVLVAYSDSDSNSDTEDVSSADIENAKAKLFETQSESGSKKRKATEIDDQTSQRARLPAIPSSLHSLYATEVRSSTSDDPTLHGGRQRQVPHMQGQWPSHVYLEWFPTKDEFACLTDMIGKAQRQFEPDERDLPKTKITSLIESSLGVQLPLHISLSAPLSLSTSNKDTFTTHLTQRLKGSGVQRFNVVLQGLDWVSNVERSRHFLVLRLGRPLHDELNKLLRVCNNVCKLFDLPLLYHKDHSVGIAVDERTEQDPGSQLHAPDDDKSQVFHISIAWTLIHPSMKTIQDVRAISAHDSGMTDVSFEEVKVKIGNTVSESALSVS